MNFFEQELRKIVEHCGYIRNPKFVGRACVGRLTDDITVKLNFITRRYTEKYDCLQITLINRHESKLDTQSIAFEDMWKPARVTGSMVNMHFWLDVHGYEWYARIPTRAEYMELADSVNEYLSCFTEPEMEETEDMGMSM